MAEPLTIRFASDIDAAKRGVASLASSVATNAISMATTLKAVNDNAARVTSTMAALPSAFRNVAVGVAGFLALKAAIDITSAAAQAAQERLEGLLKIASQAQAAGVGTTFLQGWTLQAKELNTEAGKLDQMLNRAREASTVRIGEGDKDATSAIQDRLKQNVLAGNLDQGALDRFVGSGDQEARIRVILDLIEQLRAKGAQLAAFDLAKTMFGSDFEAKLRDGVDVIGRMRAAMDGLTTAGGERVKTEEEIATAQRANLMLAQARNTLAAALRPIQEDIASWENQQLLALAQVKQLAADIVGIFGKMYEIIRQMGDAITSLGNASIWGKIFDAADKLGLITNFGPGKLVEPLTEADRAPKKPPVPVIAEPAGDTSNTLPPLKAKPDAKAEKDAVDSYIESLQRSTAALKAEVAAYGLSNAEKQKAIALARGEEIAKQRGSALTDDEIRRLSEVGTAAGVARDKLAALQQQSALTAEAIRGFGQLGVDALTSLIVEGKSFDAVLRSMLTQLLKWSIQASLLGTGPLAGLFGTAPAPGGVGAASVGGLAGILGKAITGSGATTSSTASTSTAATTATTAASTSTGSIVSSLASTAAKAAPSRFGFDPATQRFTDTASPVPAAPVQTASLPDSGSVVSSILPPIRPYFPPVNAVDASSYVRTVPTSVEPTITTSSGKIGNSLSGGGDVPAATQVLTKDIEQGGAATLDSLKGVAGEVTDGGSAITSAIGSLAKAFDSSSVPGGGGLLNLLGGGGSGGVGANAEGTEFWRGGPSVVGERGPELVHLPYGAKVIPNARIPSLVAPKVTAAPATTVHVSSPLTIQQHISGNGDDTIRQISTQAAHQIAAAYTEKHDAEINRTIGERFHNWRQSA